MTYETRMFTVCTCSLVPSISLWTSCGSNQRSPAVPAAPRTCWGTAISAICIPPHPGGIPCRVSSENRARAGGSRGHAAGGR